MGCSSGCGEKISDEKRNLKQEEKITAYLNKCNNPCISCDKGELKTTKYGIEDLKLKLFSFYQNEIDTKFSTFKSTSKTYHKLGPFNFGINPEKIGKISKRSKGGSIYFGEMKDKKRNGIGILVNNGGNTIKGKKGIESFNISEGYWKNGRLHGPGRIIGDGRLIFLLK